MPWFMRTETSLFDGFNDKEPTTLDPCLDMDANGDGDGFDEKTPMILDPCPECGRALIRLADWIPPPATAEAAWQGLAGSCVSTESAVWQWCPLTGWLTARVRVNWPRRPTLPPPAPVPVPGHVVHAVPVWIPPNQKAKVPSHLPLAR